MVKFNLDPKYTTKVVKVKKDMEVKKVTVKKVRKHKIAPVKFNLIPQD